MSHPTQTAADRDETRRAIARAVREGRYVVSGKSLAEALLRAAAVYGRAGGCRSSQPGGGPPSGGDRSTPGASASEIGSMTKTRNRK